MRRGWIRRFPGMTMGIGVGVAGGVAAAVADVFVIEAVFAFFIFGAELLPFDFVAGDVLLYSDVLDLLDLADCFEQAAFYSLLVALETLDDCWAVEVVVDYGAEQDFGLAEVVAAWGVHGGVQSFVDSGVAIEGFVFEVCKACYYDRPIADIYFGVFVFFT